MSLRGAVNIIISSPLGWLWALARVYAYLCITPFPCIAHYLCIILFPCTSSYASYINALHCIVLHTLQYTEIIPKSNNDTIFFFFFRGVMINLGVTFEVNFTRLVLIKCTKLLFQVFKFKKIYIYIYH